MTEKQGSWGTAKCFICMPFYAKKNKNYNISNSIYVPLSQTRPKQLIYKQYLFKSNWKYH